MQVSLASFRSNHTNGEMEWRIAGALVAKEKKAFSDLVTLELHAVIGRVGRQILNEVELTDRKKLRVMKRLNELSGKNRRPQYPPPPRPVMTWMEALLDQPKLHQGALDCLLKHRKNLSEEQKSSLLTPLAMKGMWDYVKTLVHEGTKYNEKPGEWNYLHEAVQQRRMGVVIICTVNQKEIDLNQKLKDGRSYLDLAAGVRSGVISEDLIEQGAFVASNKSQKNLLGILSKSGCKRAVQILVKIVPSLDLNKPVLHGRTALQIALRNQKWEVAKVLLENGAKNVYKKNQWSPLHYLAEHGKYFLIENLIKNDPELNIDSPTPSRQNTPLHLACRGQCMLVVFSLAHRGADSTIKNLNGKTPLHIYAHHPAEFYPPVMEEICKKGRLTICNDQGYTPLEVAFLYDNGKFIEHVLPLSGEFIKILRGSNTYKDFLDKIFDDDCKFVSQFYGDEMEEDYTDELIEFAFFLQDERLLRFTALFVTEDRYFQAVKRLEKNHPKENFSILYEACLKIDRRHMRAKEQLALKEPEKNFDLDELKKLFSKINFKHKKRTGYIDIKSIGGNVTKTSLKEGIELFVDRIKNKTPFLGTPSEKDEKGLIAFYENLNLVIQNIIEKLHHLNAENKKEHLPIEVSLSLVNLAIIGHWCGGRYIGGAMLLLDSLNDRKPKNWTERIDVFLYEMRRNIALKMAGTEEHNVHNFNQVMKAMGLSMGMQVAVAADYEDPFEPNNLPYEIEDDFLSNYSPLKIINRLYQTLLSKSSDLPQSELVDWIKKNVPQEWMVEKCKENYAIVYELRDKKLTEDQIATHFKKELEIYKKKNEQWIQTFKSVATHEFLEKKVYNMDTGDLRRFAVRYYLLKMGILQRIWG